MLDLFQLVQEKKDDIKKLAQRHGAYDIRIFGSVAKKNYHENSDIDFLVNFEEGTSLLDWCSLRLDLEDLLGAKVDVASEKTLKPRFKDRILGEAIRL